MFVIFIILALYLYIRGFKISALLIFFFFVTGGFNLVPDSVVSLRPPLTKNSDFAFFILLGILTIEFFFDNGFFKIDIFVKYVLLFFIFLFMCIIYNRFALGVNWGEIIRTIRFLFFLLTYFVLRNLEKEQLQNLLKCLFTVTVVTSFIYLMQIVIGQNILVETATGKTSIFDIELMRFYNQPSMLHFFVFMGIYCNPYKGAVKILTTIILVAALLGAFHRSLIGFFLLAILIGGFLRLPKLRRIQIGTITGFLFMFIILFAGNKFAKSRTFVDLQKVTNGNVKDTDFDIKDLSDATFVFRVAHFLERDEYIRKSTLSVLFGGALLTEDSKMVDKFFDFKVGLIEDLTNRVAQVDTADISYSILILRFGYLGSFLFLLIYFYLVYFFYKNRDNKFGLFSFLYMIMTLGVSFFSSNLVNAVTFLLPMVSYLIIKKTNEQHPEEEIYD